jgi:hypothetical protein
MAASVTDESGPPHTETVQLCNMSQSYCIYGLCNLKPLNQLQCLFSVANDEAMVIKQVEKEINREEVCVIYANLQVYLSRLQPDEMKEFHEIFIHDRQKLS